MPFLTRYMLHPFECPDHCFWGLHTLKQPLFRMLPQVLREFLNDFEEKMDLGANADPSQLSYPSALTAAEAPTSKKTTGKASGSSSRVTSARGRKAASSAAPARKAPAGSSASPRRPSPTETAKAAAAAVLSAPPSAPVVPSLPVNLNMDYQDGLPDTSDPVASAQRSMARAATARPSEVSRATSSRPMSARSTPRAPPAFPMGPGLSSMSGVIISNSTIATPRRPKCDPVAAHAKHAAAWKSSSFLNLGTKRVGPPVSSPPPPETMKAPRRRANEYVVPTSKRRDELVWQTRQRLRMMDSDAGGRVKSSRGTKQLVPNTFVPATEKRRDDLRWAVRTEMAWIQ